MSAPTTLATGAEPAYPSAVRDRAFRRKVLDTLGAYIRIDLVEERMFPASTILRYVAVVFPVLLYYFQSSFFAFSDQQFMLILIGAAVTAGLQDALTGLTQRLQFAQERGTLETYLVEPVPWALIPVAMNIWRSITGAVLACVMVGTGCLLGAPIEAASIPAALLVLFLGIAACNAVGTFAASFLILFKRGEPVIMLYSLAAGVLGGTLFAVSVLPGWIRWASYLVPHYYVISAERQLLMADPPADAMSPLVATGILVAFCVVAFAVGLAVFDRSLRLARRFGILSI
ncbi:ABC transporter permease [Rhizomonospora bruguierae]|uniref:ABC transporter permease n=1 Tax=Rhizomonospora bruguierae TaxID=1581705 RepID=UPI001BCF9EA4|nr:ABC transporter permease [Micromonospora sp. NBRC 107566]